MSAAAHRDPDSDLCACHMAADICPFQANFSVVAEEWGDVLKCRLSGGDGSEVVETVADMHHQFDGEENERMAKTYQGVFGSLFPYLETENPLDFNRCVTYRNHIPAYHGKLRTKLRNLVVMQSLVIPL